MIRLSKKLAEKITYDELQKYSRKYNKLEGIIRYWLDHRYSQQVNLQKWLETVSKDDLKPIYDEFNAYCKWSTLSDKEKVKKVLTFVHNNLTYTSDRVIWKVSEKWQSPLETWNLKTGDCEDGAILTYFLLRFVNIKDNRMRIVAGDVVGGGHCYVVWLSNEDGLEYPVDWCYWYVKSLSMTESYQDREDYYKGTKEWFSFNLKYSFKR